MVRPIEPTTHQGRDCKDASGLISAFGEHLVKSGRVSKEMGRILNRAEEIRLIADYWGDSVEARDTREMIEQAEFFVPTLRRMFMPES